MLSIRRALQVLALVGTLLVGTLALVLIVSQTPWFRDWLRRYVVRESKQYLNGELSIGGLTGNLLFGIGLADVAVDVSGQRVVAVKALQVDYSVFQILSSGIIIDEIKLVSPTIVVERDASGWNLARLVKKQAEEADRQGPGRPISLPSIELTDGTVTINDKVGSEAYRLPSHIDGLHLKGRFEYAPVHYSITVDDLRFRGTAPDLTLQQLAGGLSLRDDNLYLDKLNVRTGESTCVDRRGDRALPADAGDEARGQGQRVVAGVVAGRSSRPRLRAEAGVHGDLQRHDGSTGARSGCRVRSGRRQGPGDRGLRRARPRCERHPRPHAPEPRAAAQGPGTAQRPDRPGHGRSGVRLCAAGGAGDRSAAGDVRVRRPHGRGGRVFGGEREGERPARRAAHHAGRARRSVQAERRRRAASSRCRRKGARWRSI